MSDPTTSETQRNLREAQELAEALARILGAGADTLRKATADMVQLDVARRVKSILRQVRKALDAQSPEDAVAALKSLDISAD